MIEQAPELMEVGDVFNAIGLTGAFMFFMIPAMAVAILVFVLVKHKRDKKLAEERKKQAKKAEKARKLEQENIEYAKKHSKIKEPVVSKEIPTDVDFDLGPEDKHRFESLELDFDEKGNVIK